MGSEIKRVFPLSREFYEDFTFYYPFGNSPPEDFLLSVSANDCRHPAILSLGCGDLRSPMFTILNNFGLEGEISDSGFSGIRFVLNDRNATILARNILFLYLCMHLPSSGEEKNRWLASVWSLWYNHELQPEHHEMLLSSLQELSRWSVSWQEWSKCPLGKLVEFASPATFAAVKGVWCKWQSFTMSVEEMKSKRNDFQFYHMKRIGCKNREEGLKKYVELNILLQKVFFLHSTETFATIKKEFLEYLRDGFVWAETVLGIPVANSKTVVNPTLFEHAGGLYTLHYELTPYKGFILSFLYTHANLGRAEKQLLPVSDAKFQSSPLLANCVQQFTMWLQATANAIKKSSSVSFTFILEDCISLCFSWTKMLRFDAIYTSNLIDHVSPPALVLNALPLLKPTGTLFTETFPTELVDHYLEKNFGFLPELFPVFLGIHCIGHDGHYSPAVNHDPNPNLFKLIIRSYSTSLIWRNVTSNLLISESIKESQHAVESLLKFCCLKTILSWVDVTGSFESYLCVLHQFLKRVQFSTPVHEFLQPLCDSIKKEVCLKPHLIQLQTQSLLHDIHMHLTLAEDDCPVCMGKSLDTYIQQLSLSLDIDSLDMQPYSPPTFEIQFESSLGDLAILKSYSITCFKSKLDLTFFLPKHYLAQFSLLRVQMHQHLVQKEVYCGPVEHLVCSPTHDYEFMKTPLRTESDGGVCKLGYVAKHVGDADTFETVISMSDACMNMIKESKLDAKCLQQTQLQLLCGDLKLTISYPYAIDESKTHIKISKKNRIISVVVKRDGCLILNEKSTYLVNPRNPITHPKFHLGADAMEIFCNLQAYYNRSDHPLRNAKLSFTELFKHALDGHKFFTFSFPSKRLANSPDVYALVYVHNLRFNTVFSSPALDVSYCFLDTKPQHLLSEFHRMAYDQELSNILGFPCSVMVNDAEYEFLKDVFKYFSSTIRCPFRSDLNIVTRTIEAHKLWEHFDHAILFPLYPNPANSTYQKFKKFLGATSGIRRPGDLPTGQVLMIGQGKNDVCSFCQASAVPLKCEQCLKASYCSSECQEMHRNFHSLVCKQNDSTLSLESTNDNPKFVEEKRDEAKKDVKSSSPTADTTQCARCKKPAVILCQCQQVSYCSEPCQTLEWLGHSEKCKQPFHNTSQKVNSKEKVSSENAKRVPVGAECARCKKPSAILCQCQQVSYCSKACQTLEWPGHGEKCKKLSCLVATRKARSSDSTEEAQVPTGKPKTHSPQKHSGNECERCKKPATITCKCKQVSYCSELCKTLEQPVHSEACVRASQDLTKPHSPPERKRLTDTESKRMTDIESSKKEYYKCYNCGKTKSSLQHCKCRDAFYCSVECQKLHWPQHKTTCSTVRK
jgi:hypothetical protein